MSFHGALLCCHYSPVPGNCLGANGQVPNLSQPLPTARGRILANRVTKTEQTNYELIVSQYLLDETPIEEIHRIRREISDRFGGDIAAISADADRRARASGRPIWQPKMTNRTMQQSGDADTTSNGQSTTVRQLGRQLKHQWLFLNQIDSATSVRRLVGIYVEQHDTVVPHFASQGQTIQSI